ncbi:SidA/IucD/PvdA family monooxygenase [Mesorhizobium amorphae]|uniref:SidA/IucD/PvdA family monooxygenase n=1 Tax=Mesorhizobium amorphae TaxID=71433 RepID=UPI0024E0ADEF|nr:SidA/IucD/PvdA family monooxygenase [Mesorhizobium amorphae]
MERLYLIGIGPFNLNLAALAQPTPLGIMFFEKEAGSAWHPRLLLPNSRLQVSPLKDCVALADPASPYSFPNYFSVRGGHLHALLASHNADQRRTVAVDRIILATGFQPRALPFIGTVLASACIEDSLPVVRADYAGKFKDNISGRVYFLNRTRVQNCLQRVDLSLAAVQNSRVINSLYRNEYNPCAPDSSLRTWTIFLTWKRNRIAQIHRNGVHPTASLPVPALPFQRTQDLTGAGIRFFKKMVLSKRRLLVC